MKENYTKHIKSFCVKLIWTYYKLENFNSTLINIIFFFHISTIYAFCFWNTPKLIFDIILLFTICFYGQHLYRFKAQFKNHSYIYLYPSSLNSSHLFGSFVNDQLIEFLASVFRSLSRQQTFVSPNFSLLTPESLRKLIKDIDFWNIIDHLE